MRKQFVNPPIMEALIEVGFNSDKPWELTIPGLFYAQVFDRFPVRNQVPPITHRVFVGASPSDAEGGQVPMPPVSQPQRSQFFNENRTTVVQVAENLLAVNQLHPYQGWDELRRIFDDTYRKYLAVGEPKGIHHIELRYINKISMPYNQENNNFDPNTYVNVLPSLPKALIDGKSVVGFDQSVAIEVSKEPLAYLKVHVVIPEAFTGDSENIATYNIAIAIRGTFGDLAPDSEAVYRWIDDAHEKIDEVFFECIKPAAFELFGGFKEDQQGQG